MQQESSLRTISRSSGFLALCLMLVFTIASCTKPKKDDGEGAAESSGMSESAAPQLADKDIGLDAQGSDSGNISGLDTVFFDYDKAALTSAAKATLKANADWIKANPKYTVQVEGHTDSRGSTEYNLSLGERRAKSVRTYLEGLGVEGKRLTVLSYGEEKPLAQGDSETAFSKNRRANFVPLQ
jgi:peptidoglycan-associated lipoprotein